ncbi:benzoate transporter, partial [Thioclava sp. BHET1]
AALPMSVASAMLAGVLMELCLAPVHAVAEMPTLALPVVLAWVLGWWLARRYAVLIAVAVAAVLIAATTTLPTDRLAALWPAPVLVAPVFDLLPAISLAIPLFIVTMASQNVPGLAVLRANGYDTPLGETFVATGLASMATAPFGGHGINLS